MVFMPNVNNVGVSQKIEDETERQRLRDILTRFAEENDINAGFIARTAAEGVSESRCRPTCGSCCACGVRSRNAPPPHHTAN
jgi:Ribonuclease G/E